MYTLNMDTKQCANCGIIFTYNWDDIGELFSDICIHCMTMEMTEEERTQDKELGRKILEHLNLLD